MSSWARELREAAKNDNLKVFKGILTRSDISNIGRSEWMLGEDALHEAAWFGRNEMVQLLFDAGIDVNSFVVCPGGDRCTALHRAVQNNQKPTVKLLLSLGADATLRGKRDQYSGLPVDWARQQCWRDIARVLEEHRLSAPVVHGTGMREAGRADEQIISMEDVQKNALKENELREALEVKKQLDAKSTRISSIDAEMRQLDNEKKTLAAEMAELQAQPNYRTDRQIEMIGKQVEKIKRFASAIKDMILPCNDSDNRCCPVCLQAPTQVFSCLECDNWFCGVCREQLVTCPNCREDFLANPPRRNRAVERVLGI